MDFSKYLSLLDQKSLFFCRLDLFEDSQEGLSPKNEIEFLENLLNKQGKNRVVDKSFLRQQEKWSRKNIAINCWHINDFESTAMWKIYLQTGEGLAIKSTFKRLCDSFHVHTDDEISIGIVNYHDYDSHLWGNKLWFNILNKRIFFEYEKELRAVILRYPKEMNKAKDVTELFKTAGIMGGINAKVDLEILVEEVIISPFAPTWFKNLVSSVTTKYNSNIKVNQSSITH